MAQKVQILLVDDIDGGEADETLSFSLDGRTYEIDLSTGNADKLRELLDPFVSAGRKVGGRGVSTRRGAGVKAPRSVGEPTAEELRKWATDHGYEVSARGRVPASIKSAYAAANS
ncbi:histone-like nucleoid-structuring protein Lsr2 [Streptomyces sp. NPDC005955]|uniref:histone-like nucleoid-structuring protein Lsr2 n=1 Tax=Streptomyces sp. NPDC005955 TaxID=3364738 RepID=UPI00369C75B7